jgi:AcrR family transcriptional regulator
MENKAKTGEHRPRRSSWKQNPEAVQADILRVALKVFARSGLAGARVEEIAALTQTSKRMIYYYFGDKEGLYLRSLEEAYRSVRTQEAKLDLEGLGPVEALRRLVEFTFDHHRQNEDFIRLVMIENIHKAQFLETSGVIRDLNKGVIASLERVVARGKAEGLFRADVDPLAVHWQISALSFFNVSNRYTFAKVFDERLSDEDGQKMLREQTVRAVLGAVLVDRT